MSRVSLSRRIDRIRDHFLVPGSLRWRLERASDAVREQYLIYVERTDAINSRVKKRGENAFEAMLADPLLYPPMPKVLQHALWPEQAAVDREIAAGRYAEAYATMLQGDDQ